MAGLRKITAVFACVNVKFRQPQSLVLINERSVILLACQFITVFGYRPGICSALILPVPGFVGNHP